MAVQPPYLTYSYSHPSASNSGLYLQGCGSEWCPPIQIAPYQNPLPCPRTALSCRALKGDSEIDSKSTGKVACKEATCPSLHLLLFKIQKAKKRVGSRCTLLLWQEGEGVMSPPPVPPPMKIPGYGPVLTLPFPSELLLLSLQNKYRFSFLIPTPLPCFSSLLVSPLIF